MIWSVSRPWLKHSLLIYVEIFMGSGSEIVYLRLSDTCL